MKILNGIPIKEIELTFYLFEYVGWLVVFNVPSTARSFRDGTPHLQSLAKDVKLDKYTVPTGN